MTGFKWTGPREQAALAFAEGYTVEEVAAQIGVTERTLYRWRADTEFANEVDRLSQMVGIATRAERLRIAMRVIRQKIRTGEIETTRDVLDWLKYAQGETDGLKLDLTAILETVEGGPGAAR